MSRAAKNTRAALLTANAGRWAARRTANFLRVEAAELECQRAEKARDAAQGAVTAAYIELGRALLAGEVGERLRAARGRK